VLLTLRGLVVIALGIFSVFAARNSGQPVFLLLSTVGAAAFVVSALSALRLRSGLAFQRFLPERVYKGDPVGVQVAIQNTGAAKSLFFLVDEAKVWTDKTEVAVAVDAVRSFETRRFSFDMPTARRGVCRFESISVETGAPFGLLRWRAKKPLPGSTLILPFPGRVWDWDCPGGRRHSGIGVESLDRSGTSHEYLGAREYHPEDPMRYIHWKLMARMQRPMVRDFQTTSSLEVELVPDLTGADYQHGAGPQMLEAVVSITASMAAELIRRGYFVRLWLPDKRLRSTFLEAGSAHLEKILAELAEAEANRAEPYADTLARLEIWFAPRSAVVCVMPYQVLALTAGAVATLGGRGYQPQVALVEPAASGRDASEAPQAAIEAAVTRTGAPCWRFRADDDFRNIRMLEHRARAAGFQAVRAKI